MACFKKAGGNMYAIIRTGGKQYKVQAGDRLKVEKVDHVLGSEFDVTDILMIGGDSTHIGQPTVKNAKVTVVVTKQTKDSKVIVFKKKRRKGYRKFKTHRQPYSELFIKAITSPDGKVAKADSEAKVVDIVAQRAERIEAKVAARKERVSKKSTDEADVKVTKKATAAKKTVTKKKTSKKAAPKKTTKRKASKTAAKKKTTKKASK